MATRNYDGKGKEKAKKADVGPNSRDQFLRRFKFQIHSRPKDGPAVWTRGGRNYHESEAIQIACEEKRQREAKLKLAMEDE